MSGSKRLRSVHAALIAVGIAASSLVLSLPAAAADASSVHTKIDSTAAGVVTVASDGTASSKRAWLAAHPETAKPGGILPDYTVSNKELYSKGHTNMHGSYSSVSGKTDADVTAGWEEYADFKKSSATVDWWGGSPINAQQLQASMRWKVSGIDVSVSLPAGLGFSRSGSSVTWEPPSIANTWHETLTRSSSVHFSTPFTFYSDAFYADANVLIGSHWYYVAGN